MDKQLVARPRVVAYRAARRGPPTDEKVAGWVSVAIIFGGSAILWALALSAVWAASAR